MTYLSFSRQLSDVSPELPRNSRNSRHATGYKDAFLYNSGTMQDLGRLPFCTHSDGLGINDLGQVVGVSGNSVDEEAFIYTNGATQDLNDMIPSSANWALQVATAINDKGQICGYGINPSGQTDTFLLNPIPEPSTLALVGTGGLCLLCYVWRRRLRFGAILAAVLLPERERKGDITDKSGKPWAHVSLPAFESHRLASHAT